MSFLSDKDNIKVESYSFRLLYSFRHSFFSEKLYVYIRFTQRYTYNAVSENDVLSYVFYKLGIDEID